MPTPANPTRKLLRLTVPGPNGPMQVTIPAEGNNIPGVGGGRDGNNNGSSSDDGLAPEYAEMLKFSRAVQRSRVAARILTADDQPRVNEPQIKANIDLGKIVEMMLLNASKTPTSSPEMLDFKHTLQDLDRRLQGGQANPIGVYRDMIGLMGELKKELGIAPTPQSEQGASLSQLPMLVELEKLKLDREESGRRWEHEQKQAQLRWETEQKERQRQYDEEKEERHRRWVIEDRQWQESQKMNMAKMQADSHKQDQLVGTLGKLFGAGADSLEEAEEAGANAPASQAVPAARKVVEGQAVATKFIQCQADGCDTQIPIPANATGGTKLNCPTCNEEYTLEEREPAPVNQEA